MSFLKLKITDKFSFEPKQKFGQVDILFVSEMQDTGVWAEDPVLG